MPTNHYLNSEHNEMTARPKPPVTAYIAKNTKYFCATCANLGAPVVMCYGIDFDEPSQIVELQCNHFRPVAVKTVGA
jgi:hypothetical protein